MKFKYVLMGSLLSSLLVGCGNLSDVTEQGTTADPVWPKIEDSYFVHDGQYGSWVSKDNLALLEKGMNKKQIYNLLGRPHFHEGLYGVREWDYIFNFNENGNHKICQFKILFDEDMNAQTLLWKPENCLHNKGNGYELSGDFLFAFDSDQLNQKGREHINQVAKQLIEQKATRIKVASYSDPIGSDAYNLALSQRRANTVKQYLVSTGIDASHISAVGYGKANQVKRCDNETGQALRDCLAPNRRVVISAE